MTQAKHRGLLIGAMILFHVVGCGRERVKLPAQKPKASTQKTEASPAPVAQTQQAQEYDPARQIPNIANYTSIGFVVTLIYVSNTAHPCPFDQVGTWTSTANAAVTATNIQLATVRNNLVKSLFPQWSGFAEQALNQSAYAFGANPTAGPKGGAYVAFGYQNGATYSNPSGYKPEIQGANIPAGLGPIAICGSFYKP